MMKKFLGLTAGLAALWVWAPGCSQPKPQCTVGTASYYPFTAKFFPQGGDEPCNAIPGDLVGMQTYNPADAAGEKPDLATKIFAIQAATMGAIDSGAQDLDAELESMGLDGAPDEDPNRKIYSIGNFENPEPDDTDFCRVPTLSPAQIVLAEVPAPPPVGGGGAGGGGGGGGAPPQPPLQDALDLTYEWSNIEVYVAASSLGVQVQGDLTYTENGCTARYRMVALWPAVGCEELGFFKPADPTGAVGCDACGDPSSCVRCEPGVDDAPDCADLGTCCDVYNTCLPNNALCDATADPEPPYELPFGSGISPDLRVKCDEALLLCVLDSDAVQTTPAE